VVVEAALYSSGALEELGDQVQWITRVPASLSLVNSLYQTTDPQTMIPVLDDAYRVGPLCTSYGGVRQRWVVVYSEAIHQRQCHTLRKRIDQSK
jgi:transposase